ncbi:target of Nesh-SH3 isoform X17 [Aquarana catesbeiana]|uniref:target of Nesh-SH3 isoform X17 n=1 Tax=Aquarana catesbeiana TaxID=8400 RepID=UPI003CCA1CB5
MISRVFFLFLFGVISAHLGYAQKLSKVKKPNMKVHINITRDTLTMKFHRPNQSIKLEGFILGYGSNYFTNQYIQWPDNGKSFITDVEAEARYLIAVKPNENQKTCKEKNSSRKPLQLVIGTLTPTSVYLSWGILINPQIDWSALSKCPNDRFYTVRYREKNKDWNFQLCPTTETVVDNLKPNTAYEFCVKDNSDDEIWSKPQNHKTSSKGKDNGNIENTYKIPKGTLQYASEDTKALIPVIVVKQGFQNITKSTAAPPPTVQSPVFREKTKKPPLTTTRPPTPKPKPVFFLLASKESQPIPKTSEKTIAEDPKPAVTSQTIAESFTPDSSTGTLEWVRAVAHPYIQATNIPAESSVLDEQSSPLEVNMAPSEEFPQSLVPAQTRTTVYLASSTISPVSFTKELPILQPETVLASDELATYVPQPMTVSHIIPDVPESNDVQQVSTGMPIKLRTTSGKGMHPKTTLVSKLSTHRPFQKHTTTIAGEEPISSEVPKLQSSTVSSGLLPEPHRTIAGDVPESNDVPQVSTDMPIKLHTTSGKGMHPKTTLVSKLSTHRPFQKHTTTIGSDQLATSVPQPITASHIIPAGEEPISNEVPQLQSSTVSSDLLPEPHRTIAGDVPESIDVQQVSTDMPIKLRTTSDKGMHPKSTLVSKLSTYLPFQKHTSTIGDVPESIDVQQVSTDMPIKLRTTSDKAGEEPISSEVPKLQSSTVSSGLLPEPHRTIAGDVPEPIDVQQVSTDMPIKLCTTSGKGMHPKSTLVSKLSTHLPFQKHTSTIVSDFIMALSPGDVPESIDVPQVSTDMPIKLRTTSGKGMHPKPTLVSKLSTHLPFQKHKTTIAAKMKQPIYGPTTISSLEKAHTYHATTSQYIPGKQSTMPSKTHKKTTAFIGDPSAVTTPKSIVRTTVQHPIPVPNEILSFHPKPVPSTEAPESEADSTLPESEIITTDALHIYEPEKTTLASNGHFVVQKHTSTAKSHTTIAYRTTTTSFSTNTPTTSQRIQSTMASKKQGVSPAQPKIPLPKKTQTTTVPAKTQKITHKMDSTVGPTPQTGKTEKDVTSKPHKTSQSPPPTAVPKPAQTVKMPINLIRLHIYPDPALPSVQSETQTTAPPTPKTTQSNKIPQSKPAPKTIQKVPIHVISIQVFDEPDVPMVPNTTLPTHSTTTQRPESPHTTPVPVQKVPQPITQKPKSSPRTRTKPAPTAAPKETTTLPKIPHVTAAATLATYRVQHSSSRPRTSLRPRTRPAQNGTTQGSIRPRPTGDFNWVPGTIPGGRVLDSTKLLGVSRNISMEPNNTGKRTFSVSVPPLPPVKPTSIRRRIQYNNVTGRPRVTVSSPPLPPVKPTTIRRRPPTNVTARPIPAGCVLISRAPSAPKLNCTVIYIKPPKVQPTLPATDEDFVDPTVFNPSPKSDVDALGKPRFTGPHVKYINKEDNIPCSITESLKHFPAEEGSIQDVSAPPQNPPSNLTVVTVEGCSSFVILDWEMPNNDTATEFKVISTENGAPGGKNQSIITTNQTYSTVENLKPDTKYDFKVVPTNPLGEGPVSVTVEFSTESADPRVSEPVTGGKDAIWTEIRFKSDSYSECRGKQYVKRTWYKKFVGIQLCNSLRYKIYLSNSLTGTFYNIGDQSGYGEDHCQFVDSFLDGRTGQRILPEQLTDRKGFYRSVRQQPVEFGDIGGRTHISYVHWYECGIAIPGKW